MKKLNLSLLILVMASFLFVGCKKSPEDLAVKFVKLYSNCEFKKAAQLGDKDTKEFMNFVQSMTSEEEIKNSKKKISSIKVVETNIEDDTAEVTLSITEEGGEPEEQDIKLVKVNGDWKVHFTK